MTPVRSTLLVGIALCSCNGSNGGGSHPTPPEAGPPLIFDTNVRQNYTLVRSCRSPGEHSGLNAYTVWVNATGASSYADVWKDPPAVTALAAGSLVVKEIYSSADCTPATVEHWVAMEKRPGFDPTNGDWFWQDVSASGKVRTNGTDAACIQCHTGNDPSSSCNGYGMKAGRDYLCTAPP